MKKETNIYNEFFTRGFHVKPNLISNNESFFKSGCCKLDSVNWLKDIPKKSLQQNEFVEVRFKSDRKDFFKKPKELQVHEGDIVAVESSPGHDVGVVSLTGRVVLYQMQKKGVNPKQHPLKSIYRKAKINDIEKWILSVNQEENAKVISRRIAHELGLEMKINDVEYQGDNTKAIFYYTAEERVDFRELIKLLADRFKIRIEMKQIGARQEAGKVGGIGSCGREMCCSTWLTSFQSVSTSSARTQQISLNPQKLAGQCGKLKCCLNYEQKLYEEALKEFPPNNARLITKKGIGILQKLDVYKQILWFSYEGDKFGMVPIALSNVNKIIKLNQANKEPESLEEFAIENKEKEIGFNSVVGQDDLNRFDKKSKNNRSNRNNRNKKRRRNKKTLSILLLFAALLSGCSSNYIANEYKSIDNKGWDMNDTISFDVNIPDAASTYTFDLNIRHDVNYQYQNLYFFTLTQFPDGNRVKDTIEVFLAKKNGEWMGKGYGAVKTVENRIIEKARFKQKGMYTFSFIQAMRKNKLEHIKEIGITVSQDKS
ncbi:MAG: hypothetical protein CSA94_00495 [Bacteroidetes bacterium]|nr:MAG: hypothetical protein CSA94_00495 [Bacteroidota bacterium]